MWWKMMFYASNGLISVRTSWIAPMFCFCCMHSHVFQFRTIKYIRTVLFDVHDRQHLKTSVHCVPIMTDMIVNCVLSTAQYAYRNGWSASDPWINTRAEQRFDDIVYKTWTFAKSSTTHLGKLVNKLHERRRTRQHFHFDTIYFWGNLSKCTALSSESEYVSSHTKMKRIALERTKIKQGHFCISAHRINFDTLNVSVCFFTGGLQAWMLLEQVNGRLKRSRNIQSARREEQWMSACTVCALLTANTIKSEVAFLCEGVRLVRRLFLLLITPVDITANQQMALKIYRILYFILVSHIE